MVENKDLITDDNIENNYDSELDTTAIYDQKKIVEFAKKNQIGLLLLLVGLSVNLVTQIVNKYNSINLVNYSDKDAVLYSLGLCIFTLGFILISFSSRDRLNTFLIMYFCALILDLFFINEYMIIGYLMKLLIIVIADLYFILYILAKIIYRMDTKLWDSYDDFINHLEHKNLRNGLQKILTVCPNIKRLSKKYKY